MKTEDFSFPYKPYDIQSNLMKEIYDCIEEGKIGIFESPTGTGKTLSVICSTMTWLENFLHETEAHLTKIANTKIETDDKTQDWITAYKESQATRKNVDEAKDKLEELAKIKEKLRRAEEGIVETKKRKLGVTTEAEEEEDFGPEEYNSDNENDHDRAEEEECLITVKIYYASRTHSQLGQIVDELSKTKFKPRLVTVASRQALCANENVQKLKINHLINEKCMELRKNCGSCAKKSKNDENKESRKSGTSGCPYYKMEAIEDLSNGILSKRLYRPDQLVSSAQKSVACPYFATRKSVPLCQLVLLPYQVLLHSATRAAWNIELEGNVVVLDEAHNVLQTIGNIHSCEISFSSLKVALHLVNQYIETYKLRLKTKNLMYMRQLLTVVSALDRFFQNPSGENVLTIQGFLIKLQLTGINLFKLVHYIETTDLCRKFHGFYLRYQKNKHQLNNTEEKHSGLQKLLNKKKEENMQSMPVEQPRPIPSPLFSIKTFIEALNNKCEDGRIIVDSGSGSNVPAKLKFILLNPASQLQDLVDKARATILIGGTMEPAGLLFNCLTKGRDPSRVKRFSCEHVIDSTQLAAFVVDKTSDNQSFSLTYQTRGNDRIIRSLALSLIELVKLIPNGCVTFFTSYDVMNNFVNFLKRGNLFSKLEENKKIYVEPRAGGDSKVWQMFVTAARSSKGAILFAVVGGKMSEGINFSDELGRAVIMIGLPYPNKNSIELQENMKYLNETIPGGGKQLYDSLCMHSVNQAIGRAIRHRRDYAAVYLFDSRFSQQMVRTQLSTWISKRVQISPSFNDVLEKTRVFFSQNS